jgi:hypothetical protein
MADPTVTGNISKATMTCRACEQMRRAVDGAWRRLTRPRCVIPGCPKHGLPHLCVEHWRALPLSLRQRWWDETRYGHATPSAALARETIDALTKG